MRISREPSLEQVICALRQSWSNETTFCHSEWSRQNPARGQCVVSCLVLQDYFGGELRRYQVIGDGIEERHYRNELEGGVLIDTTASQYDTSVQMTDLPILLGKFASIREKRLSDDDTRERYELLARKVADTLNEAQ